jgi:hypothetical protein
MALIPIPPGPDEAPLINAALAGAAASRWVNPDHITHLIPRTISDGFSLELVADVKLQGLPESQWHLGTYRDRDSAEAAWAEFISYLT